MSRILGIAGKNTGDGIRRMISALSAGAAVPPRAVRTLSVGASIAMAATSHCDHVNAADAGGVTVVLDGAVYHDHDQSPGNGDADRVLDLYLKNGFEGALSRLNGEFAIALCDARDKSLWLGRDRLGVKPLYYASTPHLFAFASRPRPLIGLPGVGNEINCRFAAVFAGSHYRYFDNYPEESPYRNVAQLRAAHWLRFSNGEIKTGCYWRVSDATEWTASEDELAEKYRELLLDAVGLRVRKSSRPAFTLSGGMDSSSVLASAALLTQTRFPAYSTVYTDKTFDESDEIKPMLEHSVSKWHPVQVDDPDVFSLIKRMVEANDEPVATATWLSHFLLCEAAARDGVGTLFGGLGGDELNAGEYEYFFFHFADLAAAGRTTELDHEIARWVTHHDHPVHKKTPDVAAHMMARCADPARLGRCLPDEQRRRRYHSTMDPAFFDVDKFEPIIEAPFASYLKTRTWQDLSRETAPCCLRAEDRQTQAFGLDNMVPFFDHRLVEFMFKVPGSLKIRDGITKVLLRKAMQGILPEETRTRIKKTGWNAPAHLWFSGKGQAPLMDLLHSRKFRERGIYQTAEVLRLADEHKQIVESGAARENHMMFFWQLVNLEVWLDERGPS